MNEAATADGSGVSEEGAGSGPLPFSDAPLTLPEQDRLGRADFAKFIAQAITSADLGEGFVLALHGEWGSGKSSTLNFVRHYVEASGLGEGAPVIAQFNPWWFSGREELLQQFFHQLTASMEKPGMLRRLGRWLAQWVLRAPRFLSWFAEIVLGGPERLVIAGASHVVRKYADSLLGLDERVDPIEQRARVEEALAAFNRRILVLVDDIDRLPGTEIRDMFRVIKAVADFPNTIYLLAFDRTIVAKALDGPDATGESYVEKIVQAGFDLPPAQPAELRQLLLEQLPAIVSGTPPDLWDELEWYNLYLKGVDPLVRTPRDVKRYLNVLRPSYSVVRGEVNAVDFLAFEAVRVFAAPVYYEIRARPGLFAGTSGVFAWMDDRLEAPTKDEFTAVLQLIGDGSQRTAVHNLLMSLFPRYARAFGGPVYSSGRAGVWRRQARICSPEIFPVYFRLSVPRSALSKAEMDALLSLAGQPAALTTRLRELATEPGARGGSRASQFLGYLPDYIREDIPEAHIEGLIQSLHDAGDDLIRANGGHGPFDVRNEIQVVVITHQLLERIVDQPRRFEILRGVLSSARSITLIVHQLHALGQQHGRYGGMTAERSEEDQLLSADHLDDLQEIVLDRIEDAAANDALRTVPQLGCVLHFWQALAGEEPARRYADRLIESAEGVAVFLQGFLQESYTQALGDHVGQRHYYVQIPHIERLAEVAELRGTAERILAENPSWLTERERLALQAFLRDLNNKPSGYGPLDTPE